MGLPWGTWGFYLRITWVFSEPLSPLGLPIPSNAMVASKNEKNSMGLWPHQL